MFSPAKPGIDQRLKDLTSNFATYVAAFDNAPPFKPKQLGIHLRTLELRSRFPNASTAACNETFTRSVRKTLHLWGIGTQGGELVSPQEFHNQLCRVASMLTPLECRRIDDPHIKVRATACLIWEIIRQLNIVTARKSKEPVQNKVVGGTKALHHLLPDLVFPMDREYTQSFFGWSNPQFQNHPEECFKFAYQTVSGVAREVDLAKYIGAGWRTSRAKILDNAIVAFCKVNGLVSDNKRYRRRQQQKLNEIKAKLKAAGKWEEFQAELKRRLESRSDLDNTGD